MSEITKLYENAGIEPKYIDACTVEDKYWQNEELANEYGTFDMYMNAKCGQQEDCTTLCSCAYTKEEYPPFTAEKQIELIKWLFTISDISNINIEYENKKICIHNILGQSDDCDTLEDALASYINDIWQDLTEQERTEIADILKG